MPFWGIVLRKSSKISNFEFDQRGGGGGGGAWLRLPLAAIRFPFCLPVTDYSMEHIIL